MPEQYGPKRRDFPLSRLIDSRQFVRVACTYCKRKHHYYPHDLIEVFGDVDVDSLMHRIKCENCDKGSMDVRAILPTGMDAVGMKIRRLVALKIRHVPVWRED